MSYYPKYVKVFGLLNANILENQTIASGGALGGMDVLDEAAKLIRENPSLTVKELAKKLGYAEQKSVYYWLAKTRWKGIKAFKKAVLTGEFASRTRKAQVVKESRGSSVVELPVAVNFSDDGFPIFEQEPVLAVVSVGPSAYGLIMNHDGYYPWVHKGDILVLDPDVPIKDGDTVALLSGDKKVLLGYAFRPEGHAIVEFVYLDIKDPRKGISLKGSTMRRLGRVVQLIRDLCRRQT